MASAPPGFVRDAPAAARAPAPPPGFVREMVPGLAPAALPYPSFDVREPPMQRMHEQDWPSRPPRPEMPDSSGGQEMDFTPVKEFAKEQAGITEAHYRNLANLPGAPFKEMVDPPTPEAQAEYMGEVITGLLTIGGGATGKMLGTKLPDALKYLGRGFRTEAGAGRFLASNAPHVTSGGAGTGIKDFLGPAVSGAVVAGTVDALDPGPHELVDDTIATGAGVTTAAAVGKNAIDDLMLGNERWRNLMMKPSKGIASTVLGGLLGYLVGRGITGGRELVNDAANYVADLFEDEEATPDTAPPAGQSR